MIGIDLKINNALHLSQNQNDSINIDPRNYESNMSKDQSITRMSKIPEIESLKDRRFNKYLKGLGLSQEKTYDDRIIPKITIEIIILRQMIKWRILARKALRQKGADTKAYSRCTKSFRTLERGNGGAGELGFELEVNYWGKTNKLSKRRK